ncbi:MAG TPA: TonB-dependent receptor [Polyangia bacterium]|nr:TonB-dependent receptor [Polyangia bacterium]
MSITLIVFVIAPGPWRTARAHPSAEEAEAPALPVADAPLTLRKYVDPVYPEDAKRLGLGGTVAVRLQVSAEGKVTAAAIEQGISPAFDEAALAAARQLEFHPAHSGGRAITSTLRFEFRFTPPGHTHTEPSGVPAEVPPHSHQAATADDGAPYTTVISTERPLTAASARTVRDRDLKLRPILRPADLFKVTPGLMIVQHAGGGKANQYLLRGFDADHGTDVALSFDGLPLNMVSHGHGQGYADSNFVIPELIERVEVSKGPYFVESGDFATAGSIDLVTRDSAESLVSVGGGSFNTWRTVAIAAPTGDSAWHPLLAAEVVRTDGPFSNPERFNKYNLFGKLTYDIDSRSRIWVAGSSYNGSWNASGQIPSRAVRAGLVDFFGALDPSEGGQAARHNIYAGYRMRPDAQSEFQALAYLTAADFALYSNFTFFSRDPINGDEIEQRDNRTILGARTSYRWLHQWRGILFDSLLGGSARHDDITNGLSYVRARERLSDVVDTDIHQTSVAAYAKEEVQPVWWLRLCAGVRADHTTFQVNDRLEDLATLGTATSGSRGATRISPKASVVLSPHRSTDLFLNFGYGFHSNDARGVVRSADAVTPLTRTVGYELGLRSRLLDGRLDAAVALWGIDIDSEMVWVGDRGTTEAAGATRRVGVEVEGRWAVLPWLFADADLTYADAKFRQNAGNGQAIALAPRLTAAGGISALHPSGLRGALRGLYIAQRPATEDGFLQAEATQLLDLFVAHRWRSFELALALENVINRRNKSAQFATVTRLQGEVPTNAQPPAGACPPGTRASVDAASGNFVGCEDVSFSPANPFSFRLTGTYYF